MMSTLQIWLLPVLAALAVLVSPAAAQNKLVNDLSFALPLPIIFIILIIIGIVIFCVMRRARYGYFCCLKPRVVYLPDPPSSENSDSDEEAESGTANQNSAQETSLQAPGYSPHPNSIIAPPDYQDALQDVLVVPSRDPNQPPAYVNNEGNENEDNGESSNNNNEPDSSAEQPAAPGDQPLGQEEPSVNQQPQPELEEVDLDDDSTESYDDTTPLNP